MSMTAPKGVRMRVDRRKSSRLPLAIPVFVRGPQGEAGNLLEFTTAVDVSAGGMLVATRHLLPVATRLRLEIPSGPLAGFAGLPVSCSSFRGRVVRNLASGGHYLLAVKFLRPLGKRPLRRAQPTAAARLRSGSAPSS